MTLMLVAPVPSGHTGGAPVPTMDRAFLYTLQPLKMQSGACPATKQEREEGSQPAAPYCRCAHGRAGEVPGEWG